MMFFSFMPFILLLLKTAVVAGLGFYAYHLSVQLDSCEVKNKIFLVQMKEMGENAIKEKEKIEFQNKRNNDVQIEKYKNDIFAYRNDIKRLRNHADSNRYSMPPIPENSNSNLICFNRKKFSDGHRKIFSNLQKGIRKTIDECAEKSIQLERIKEWSENSK